MNKRKLTTRLNNKRDDFNFPIVNFPFLSSNIPYVPVHGVNVSQLIRNARACFEYQHTIERGRLLSMNLLTKLVLTRKKLYGRHHDLVNPYNVVVSGLISNALATAKP